MTFLVARTLTALLFASLFASTSAAQSATDATPEDSVYQLRAEFSDQSGQSFELRDRRGKPQLVAMFYTSCRYVCPLIVDSAKGVERKLDSAQREQLGILLVSIDPARDDTAALKSIADKRRLDPAHWTLARTDEAHVRALAALLNVRYRALADGEFNHTSALVLLDAEGRRLASTSVLGPTPDPEFMTAVRAALAQTAEESAD